jgi:hypothetical protein
MVVVNGKNFIIVIALMSGGLGVMIGHQQIYLRKNDLYLIPDCLEKSGIYLN